jgi:hypothetical protein
MTDMDMRPRRRIGVGKIVLIVLVAVALFGGGLYFILSRALSPLVDSGDAFMTALRSNGDTRAYALSTPALRRALGSAEGMAARIGAYRPAEWSWSTRSIRNGVGRLRGSVSYRGGNQGSVRLQLDQVDGQWRVSSFQFN